MGKRPRYSVTEEARGRFIDDYVDRAAGLEKDAKRQFRDKRYPEVVSTVQEALEFLVKALFHSARIPPPKFHQIHDPKFAQQLRGLSDSWKAALTSSQWTRFNLPRLLFLASFWAEFYLDAKYGSDPLGAGPSQLFGRKEARLALAHFGEVVETLGDVFAEMRQDVGEGGGG